MTYDPNLPAGLPSDFNDEKEMICPDCEGEQHALSDCCGAYMDTDIMICSDCKDHCEIQTCETCEGTGTVLI